MLRSLRFRAAYPNWPDAAAAAGRRLLFALLVLLGPLPAAWAAAPTGVWRLAIFAYMPPAAVAHEWAPLKRELEQLLSEPVELLVLNQEEIEAALSRGEIDLLLTNPGHYLAIKPQFRLPSPHLTVVRFAAGQFTDQLGATLIARRDQPLPADLHALAGRRILIPGKKFLGGYQAFAYDLFRAGVDPNTVTWVEVGGHREVLRRLAAGEGDYGVIRTALWEKWSQEEPALVAPLTVALERQEPGFPYRVSSTLYPEWPLIILPHVPHEDAYAIISHLLALHLRIKALHPAEWLERGLGGFVRSADYESVRAIVRAMREPPFTEIDFTWADVWRQHREAIVVGAVGAVAVTLLAVALNILYWRLRRSHQQLAEALSERDAILKAIGQGIIVQDCSAQGTIRYANPAAAALFGYEPDALIGQPSHTLLHHSRPDGTPYPESECPIAQSCLDGQTRQLEETFWHRDGTPIPVMLTAVPFAIPRSQERAVVTAFFDLRETKRLIAENEFLAFHDPLTGLLNRRGLERALAREAARLQRSDVSATVAMIDLDHFKALNDTYGHAAGDAVLRELGQQLRAQLRPFDIASRWGGEEILLVLPQTTLADGVKVLERVREALQKAYWRTPEGAIAGVTFSAGVVPWHGSSDFETVVQAADEALYAAKRAGRNRVMSMDFTPPRKNQIKIMD